ncbi:type VII secretion-associated serine protease mycosin [Mycobacterium sp. 3519A]|uniref:type VII secretion-associated serine protease mycosin n=1 Tax=Mycobacterium sp. 3519A TaxID=2057184 RepID=UPI001F354B6B|nr:type VII secretion-associated serine protease mycosin [Mycobacterium sp. 3519A]
MLDFTAAWRFSRGAGQRVAVIDTGVAPDLRLPALVPGGDYVSTSDGLSDCDVHGTLVAGLIAAAPSPNDGFAGVAPDATIISIRQNSASFSAQGNGTSQTDPNALSSGYGNTFTLALAVAHAVDIGATVINLSEVACAPTASGLDDAALGQSVRYAFEHNVVVVAAAGNVNANGLCRTQNGEHDPNLSIEDAWKSVSTVASPAWFDDYVLTVGSVAPDGHPSDFSLHGPWIDVAAPGENVTSLGPNGIGLINAIPNAQGGLAEINGTSFAAALVSGEVALVRSRFPQLSAAEVMDRVKRTAHTPEQGPNTATGYGVVDPVAAVTDDILPSTGVPDSALAHPIAAPPRPSVDHRMLHIVLSVLGACLAVALIATLLIGKPQER